ncbi:MAG TPA: peptide chain release factor-like protein [Candidatus Hydrogenedens sp.]|nr:peptide chain release factor-like protein [Candidatus Hydrogenedens sp.]
MRFGVTPKKEQDLLQRMEQLGIAEKDLEEQFISARGPGGQKTNHTSTGVYIKHIPSGIEVKIDTSRSQSINRFLARRRLCELLELKNFGKQSAIAKKIEKERKQKEKRTRRSQKKYQKETSELKIEDI